MDTIRTKTTDILHGRQYAIVRSSIFMAPKYPKLSYVELEQFFLHNVRFGPEAVIRPRCFCGFCQAPVTSSIQLR